MYQRALAILEKALRTEEKASGPEDLKVAAALVNLAELQGDAGNYERSCILYKRAMAIHEKARIPPTITILSSFADLHRNNRRYSDARRLYERALTMQGKKWGSQSMAVAPRLVKLARLEVAQGRLSEAALIFRRATAIAQKHHGESPMFFYNQACYGALLKDRDKAIYFLKQAIARGFDAKYKISHNADFASLRGDPEFEAIVK